MKNFRLIMLFLFLFQIGFSQDWSVVRIQSSDKNLSQELSKKYYEVVAVKPGEFVDLLVDETQMDKLKLLGFNFEIKQTTEQLEKNMVAGKTINGYRTYSDLLTELQLLEATYPAICKLYDIGDSRGKEYLNAGNSSYLNYNHDIWALKVSDNVDIEEDEPGIFYLGNHHAREPISLEVNMYILNYILSNYGSDPAITNSVNSKQIWFVPLVNPNGHKIVIDETDVWWRKNIRDNNTNNQLDFGSTPDGVDPNRNYSWEWGGQGSSGDFYSETYRGPSPSSEPEIQAVKSLMDIHHFVTGLTYHSYGELVLYPFGYANNTHAPDRNALQELAVAMAGSIPAAGSGTYTPQESWELYPAAGVTDDYAYGEHGIFCYTIELATQFIPASTQINGICQNNLQAALTLLNRSDQSCLTGLVTDALTGLPVVAEIYIDGIDNTGVYRKPYVSDVSFGRYFRLLMDGTYSVTFSAFGYLPQTFTGVAINNSSQTILNVNLIQAQTVAVSGTITDLATGLPIENAVVEVLGTPVSPVYTNASGQYNFTGMMEGTYTIKVSSPGYATILSPKNISVSNYVFDFQMQESTPWSFESGTFESFWTFGGNANWTINNSSSSDGAYSARSGSINDMQSSVMQIELNLSAGGIVSFYCKVSSEVTYDFLRFYIDGNLQDEWSGEQDWTEVGFNVSSGVHTFTWSYVKDQSVANGFDAAWVDYIIFPPLVPLPTPPAIALNQGNFEITLAPESNVSPQLNISNGGEQNLNFSITKQYNVQKAKGYCAASGGCDEYVSRVQFNTIDNSTGCIGYADYSAISTTVEPGQSYPITIENGTLYSTDDLGIWVDWNIDQDFDDTGENVVCEISNYGQGTYNIAVPVDATPGQTRMRIRIKYNGTDCGSPCGTTQYGEVEDYGVFVNNGLPDWLTFTPQSGSIAGQNSSDVNFNFNSAGLISGDYTATASINSNDPLQPLVQIPCTLHVVDFIEMDLTVLLEGPYEYPSMLTALNSSNLLPLQQPYNTLPWNYNGSETVGIIPLPEVTDWILVELRETSGSASTATEATVIGRKAGFLLNNGNIVDLDGSSPLRFALQPTSNLFVVIYQRNHLAVMSSLPLSKNGNVYTWDFSTSATQAYGINPLNEIFSGIWGMVSGDSNGDGQIDVSDLNADWNTMAGKSGFDSADINLDGQVDNKDKDDGWVPNNGRGTEVPE